jgi:hypothetical protein
VLALAAADVGLIGALHTKENFPKFPRSGDRRAASIDNKRPPLYPQANPLERSRTGEFPPLFSTAVEGLRASGKHLQSGAICSVFAGWYARRSWRFARRRDRTTGWSTKSS